MDRDQTIFCSDTECQGSGDLSLCFLSRQPSCAAPFDECDYSRNSVTTQDPCINGPIPFCRCPAHLDQRLFELI